MAAENADQLAVSAPAQELSARDREILDFERQWWKYGSRGDGFDWVQDTPYHGRRSRRAAARWRSRCR